MFIAIWRVYLTTKNSSSALPASHTPCVWALLCSGPHLNNIATRLRPLGSGSLALSELALADFTINHSMNWTAWVRRAAVLPGKTMPGRSLPGHVPFSQDPSSSSPPWTLTVTLRNSCKSQQQAGLAAGSRLHHPPPCWRHPCPHKFGLGPQRWQLGVVCIDRGCHGPAHHAPPLHR